MHAPSNQSKCKKTRSSLQNARQRREFKDAIKILQMQNKWNGGLKDHNQNPLMSNQQKFAGVKRYHLEWQIHREYQHRRMRNSWKRKEKRRKKRIEKRRKEGPTEWELKICDPAQQLPQPDEEACKKRRDWSKRRGQTAQNAPLWSKRKRKRRERNERMEKEKEKKDLKNRRKTVFWMTPTKPLSSFDWFWISSLMLD